jgi:xanthine dehydrogenase accessory factor
VNVDLRFNEKLTEALRGHESFALVTLVEITGSAPQEVGARMLVRPDGSIEGTVGGGALEFHLVAQAKEALNDGRPRLLSIHLKDDVGMCCGGAVKAFVEPVQTATPLVIFGCGHVCRTLAPLVSRLGFALTVVDDRPEWADPAAFPENTRVLCQDIGSVCQEITRSGEPFVLAMTRGHSFDFEILRTLVDKGLPYLGIMASKSKARTFCKRLVDEHGVDPALLDRVAMPVGLPIGSQTPEEIAVSIAAQLIQERRKLRKAKQGA